MAKDYVALAKQRIHKPQSRLPRLLVYSRNKKGKTRLAATAPNLLILDAEGGTIAEKKSNPDVWDILHWEEMNDAYQFVKSGKHDYKWIALDGLPKIYNTSLRYVMRVQEERDLTRRPGFVQQSDWGKANELVNGLLWNFHTLPYGLIITSQERMLEVVELGESDEDAEEVSHRFVADVPNGCRSTVNSIVDIIGRMYIVRGEFQKKYRTRDGKTMTKTVNKQHRIWIGPHNMYDTGYRSDYVLPDYIADPKIPTMLDIIREGVK